MESKRGESKRAEGAEPEPAIVLVDHGSRAAEANAQLDEIAERLATRLPNTLIRVAHMEIAAPSIASAIDSCVEAGAQRIVIHPYFLGPGRHTQESIPGLVATACARHPNVAIAISEPLGVHEKLVDVVLERVEDALRC